MIVTSVLARGAEDGSGAKLATTKPRGALAKRIGDSKRLVAFDDNVLGEAWARALAMRGGARTPTTPAELLRGIALDADDHLRSPCPSHHEDMCWNHTGEGLKASDEDIATCVADLDKLAAKGLDVLNVKVAIVCTRRLNDAIHRGLSRFDVDLHTMERLTLAAREEAGEDVLAHCGKVGGFDFYGDRFGPLGGRLHVVLGEGRARSDYQFPGVGRLAFLRDAEDGHVLVALASLVGKWVRDHLMGRIVRYHQAHDPSLADVSGYHDPVTTEFIDATQKLRRRLKIADECFERLALSSTSKVPGPPSSKGRPKSKSPEEPSSSPLLRLS
jgi:hypothetical protein